MATRATTSEAFPAFCRALLGTWAGERERPGADLDRVEAVWEQALDGSFLEERWSTSDGRADGDVRPAARALFKVKDGLPAEFLVAYGNGKIALGATLESRAVLHRRPPWVPGP
jgi:hypothetical protein